MLKLVVQIIGGIAGIFLAVRFIPDVEFIGEIKYLIMAGAFLGLINFFIKPIIDIITLPIRVLTLGVFGLIVNMGLIWFVTLVFPELVIKGIFPLFLTTLTVWLISFFISIK